MADHCLPQVQACRARIAVLEDDGVPLPGAENLYVSSALLRVQITPVYRDGDEITEVNACGELCLDYRGDDNFRRADVTIELCTQDPYLASIFSGDLLEDPAPGGRVGWAMPPIGPVTGAGISLELWAKRINDGILDPDWPYAWHALPLVKNLRIGDREFGNSRQASMFTGQAYENVNWFDGPNNDWPGVDSDRVHQWVEAKAVEVPVAACGFQALAAS